MRKVLCGRYDLLRPSSCRLQNILVDACCSLSVSQTSGAGATFATFGTRCLAGDACRRYSCTFLFPFVMERSIRAFGSNQHRHSSVVWRMSNRKCGFSQLIIMLMSSESRRSKPKFPIITKSRQPLFVKKNCYMKGLNQTTFKCNCPGRTNIA